MALEQLELLLPALDLVLELRQRRGVLLAALDVLGEPARVGLVLRERGDEVLARHAGIAHGDDHDLLLQLAHFGDVRTQVQDQGIEHARRQPQLHEFIRELLALAQRLHDPWRRAWRSSRAPGRGSWRWRRSAWPPRSDPGRCRRLPPRCRPPLRFPLPRRPSPAAATDFQLGRVLRLRDDVRRVRVDEADDHVDQAPLAGLDRLIGAQQEVVGGRVHRERAAHRIEAFLDALGDADLALARQQLHRAHLAHVHAHRVGGAAELGIERCERRGGFLDRLLVGRLRGLGLPAATRCPVPSRTPGCPCR